MSRVLEEISISQSLEIVAAQMNNDGKSFDSPKASTPLSPKKPFVADPLKSPHMISEL